MQAKLRFFPSATAAVALLLSMTFSASAWSQSEVFRARLSPMPTTPLTKDRITGAGEVILTLNGKVLSVSGEFSGMSSAATAAHIHNGPPAQPGPVIFVLELSGDSSGSLSGELELSDEQIAALKANAFYVQVHSESNPPGELRGWVFLRSHFGD